MVGPLQEQLDHGLCQISQLLSLEVGEVEVALLKVLFLLGLTVAGLSQVDYVLVLPMALEVIGRLQLFRFLLGLLFSLLLQLLVPEALNLFL